MKTYLLLAFLVLVPYLATAQTVDVKDVTPDDDTTIEIRKTRGEDKRRKAEALWEVHDGTNDIEGDPKPMSKEARTSWKIACDEWQKSFRADNKDNKVISISCGTPTCASTSNGSTTCSSTAKYKIKTRID